MSCLGQMLTVRKGFQRWGPHAEVYLWGRDTNDIPPPPPLQTSLTINGCFPLMGPGKEAPSEGKERDTGQRCHHGRGPGKQTCPQGMCYWANQSYCNRTWNRNSLQGRDVRLECSMKGDLKWRFPHGERMLDIENNPTPIPIEEDPTT